MIEKYGLSKSSLQWYHIIRIFGWKGNSDDTCIKKITSNRDV